MCETYFSKANRLCKDLGLVFLLELLQHGAQQDAERAQLHLQHLLLELQLAGDKRAHNTPQLLGESHMELH